MILGNAEPLLGTVRVSFVGVGGSEGVTGALIGADTVAVALGQCRPQEYPQIVLKQMSAVRMGGGAHFGS